MKVILISFFTCFWIQGYSQINCNIFEKDVQKSCFEACKIVSESKAVQGTRQSQKEFDMAIKLCPNFDYAYFEKSIPYLKTGDFVTWRKLIDKAVEINPKSHLGYRGWCRFQFLRDYKGALEDFERLRALEGDNLGYSMNGDYQLNIVKGLCYKQLGNKQTAIEVIERQLAKEGYSPMPFDYLHLGILNMEVGKVDEAIKNLKRSITYNDFLADNYYYLALCYKMKGMKNEFTQSIDMAIKFYLKGYKRVDSYTHPVDVIYLSDIEKELNSFNYKKSK
jgi:predicted Zn-dependent protease